MCASAKSPEEIHAIRVAAGTADLVLGCDLVVSGTKKVLAAVSPGRTALVVNTAEVYPGDFTRDADFSLPAERLKREIKRIANGEKVDFVDATAIATALLGDAIAANMFMLGFAYQRGAVPLHADAIERGIALNGQAVAMNIEAFRLGRKAAASPEGLAKVVASLKAPTKAREISQTLDETIRAARRIPHSLSGCGLCRALSGAGRERSALPKRRPLTARRGLTEAVARNLFKLMAYKDEYEVARLYSDGSFLRQVDQTFEGQNLRFEFHLAPPLLARKDPNTGVPRKITFGPWMLKAFGLLAKFKGLRGTKLDVFGYTQERRTGRQLITDYEAMLEEIVAKLSPENHITGPRPRRDPGQNPRLRPCQGAPPRSRQGGRGGPSSSASATRRKRRQRKRRSEGIPPLFLRGRHKPTRPWHARFRARHGWCRLRFARRAPTLNRHDEIDDARSRLAVEQRGVALTGDAMRLADRVALFHFAQRLL